MSRTGHVDQAAQWLAQRLSVQPTAAVILGSGLDDLTESIERPTIWNFSEIPSFSASLTAVGHRGQLIAGWLEQTPVLVMAGRYHRYGGHSNADCMHPVRVMAALGISRLIVSNAAGGLNPRYQVGDWVLIRDHINLLGGFAAPEIEDEKRTDCRTAPSDLPVRHGNVYDRKLAAAALHEATANRFALHQGTYLATLGPNYETRAEYRMMRHFGADLAGMSTVPEVMAAIGAGMRVLALSMVSNLARPDRSAGRSEGTDHKKVLEAGREATGKMQCLVRAALRSP